MFFSTKTNSWEFWEKPKDYEETKVRAFFTLHGAVRFIERHKISNIRVVWQGEDV